MTCVSCGLPLPPGVRRCPGCGVAQALELAGVNDARCSLHFEAQASGACARCGRFMCVACAAVDAGVCRTCVELVHRDVQQRLAELIARAGWVAVAQGLLGPAICLWFAARELSWIFAVAGVVSLGFGLLTVATRELWMLGAIACGLMGFIALLAVFHLPALVVCLALGLLQARLVIRAGPLEREAWLLRKP